MKNINSKLAEYSTLKGKPKGKCKKCGKAKCTNGCSKIGK